MDKCKCGHDESDHDEGFCSECNCTFYEPEQEPEEPGVIFD